MAMTEAATRFVGAATMQALSGQPVWTDLDDRVKDAMGHIELRATVSSSSSRRRRPTSWQSWRTDSRTICCPRFASPDAVR